MQSPSGFNKALLFDFIVKHGHYDDFIDFAWWMFYSKRMSLFNAALVYVQRPGATFLETEHAWERDYKRYVKPDAVPVVVMKPFGPIEFLYEVESTYGKEFKKTRLFLNEQPFKPLEDHDLLRFTNMLKKMGIYYGEKSFGIRQYGQAELLQSPINLDSNMQLSLFDEKTVQFTRYAITVNSNLSNIDKAKTILHEIGHVLCGHLPKDSKYMPNVGFPERREDLSHEQKEFEAEKVCEIVCKTLGILFNTEDYLRYYEGVENAPFFSMRYVIDAADKVLKYL